MKLERVVFVRLYIDANDIKPGAVKSHTRATSAAKKVNRPRPLCAPACVLKHLRHCSHAVTHRRVFLSFTLCSVTEIDTARPKCQLD